MSNPYDPYNPSGPGDASGGAGSTPPPYGAPPPAYGSGSYGGPPAPGTPAPPYGNSPYGAPGGYGAAPKKTDAVSIVAFVFSFLCCLSVVGLVMGIIGLRRTKNGQRKGRWAAVASIPISLVMGLVSVGVIALVVFAVKTNVTPGNAEVGECVDITHNTSDDTYSLMKQGCGDGHDAEIVYVGTYSDLAPAGSNEQRCSALMPSDDVNKLSGGSYDWSVLLNDPANPKPDDKFICYVESSSKAQLTQGILR